MSWRQYTGTGTHRRMMANFWRAHQVSQLVDAPKVWAQVQAIDSLLRMRRGWKIFPGRPGRTPNAVEQKR